MDQLERAESELKERNYGSAIRTLEMLTARDPANADAYKHLSRAYYETGRREEAAEAAQRYASLRPTDASAHYNAGVMLAQLGQSAAAERAFRAALSADAGHAKARRALYKVAPAADEASAPGPAATSAAAPATLSRDEDRKRGPVPLPAKIAAALTVVASVAILLWLFLPGGPANPGPPDAQPEQSPHGISTPPPDTPSAQDPNVAQQPQPTPTPNLLPQPDAQTPPMAPTPQDQPVQPLPEAQQPSSPAPGAGSPPRQLFTPEQAQSVAEQMDAAERQQIEGQLRVLANWLRNDERMKDPDFWPIMQAALATSGPSMVPGGASVGTGEVMALITNSETNVQAADNIERYSRNIRSVLPWNVKQQIAQALALATNADDAYRSVHQVLQQSGHQLSADADKVLRQAAQQAEQAAQ